MEQLKIGLQKKGRLSPPSLKLLQDCGIQFSAGSGKLKTQADNFPLEMLFLRDDDIPEYVESGVVDIGIVGENLLAESQKEVEHTLSLDFAHCRLSLAIPKTVKDEGMAFFEGKTIATSYPNICRSYFEAKGMSVKLEKIGGSVEIAPSIGLADAVCDLVSTGSTLMTNGLKEVAVVMKSQAVLVRQPKLKPAQKAILDKLCFRIQAVQRASAHKYILLNAPNEALSDIAKVLPGMKSPTILPLKTPNWSSLHAVVKEDDFWTTIDSLKDMGAEGILVLPIQKMIF